MNMNHVHFQALSLQEALALERRIGQAILHAYETGMNVVLQSQDEPFEKFFEAFRNGLEEVGISVSIGQAANMFALRLRANMKEGE